MTVERSLSAVFVHKCSFSVCFSVYSGGGGWYAHPLSLYLRVICGLVILIWHIIRQSINIRDGTKEDCSQSTLTLEIHWGTSTSLLYHLTQYYHPVPVDNDDKKEQH